VPGADDRTRRTRHRPRLHAAYARERLFARIDGLRRHPLFWIFGPPGAGKTTLATTYVDARQLATIWVHLDSGDGDPASFFFYLREAAAGLGGRKLAPLPLLTPEYFGDLAGFARWWFRELFTRAPNPFMLVLDNYQEVPVESAFHRMLAAAAEEIPQGSQLLVVSRAAPSPEFARPAADERLASVEWEDLQLTLDEARELTATAGPGVGPPRRAGQSGGYAASLSRYASSSGSAIGLGATAKVSLPAFPRQTLNWVCPHFGPLPA